MKLRAENLSAQLNKQLLSMYWIAGDEPLLVQEAADLLRAHCRQQGFTERDQFFVEGSFNWQNFQQSDSNLSLFASRKIIELRLRSAKLDDAGKSALQQYLSSPNPDNVLLIVSPKLEAATLKTKWFSALEEKGALIQIWPVDIAALPQWILNRLKQRGIHADTEAVNMLADRVEGNLLAADQEIEKLSVLLHGADDADSPSAKPPVLDSRTVAQLVANSSRYNVFALIDAAISGHSLRALRMLQGLAAEGSEPLMLLAMFCKELRVLLALADKVGKGSAIASAIESERVWNNRKPAVAAALERLSYPQLQQLLLQAQRVDLSVKGALEADPWRELSDLVIQLSGISTALHSRKS
jgi:DNA polymerase III subunit delta